MANDVITAPADPEVRARELALIGDDVRKVIEASAAPNTLRAYTSAMNAFRDWCASKEVPALPASPETVAAYLTYRMRAGIKAASLAVSLSRRSAMPTGRPASRHLRNPRA